jgi:hypothetical protein
VPISDATPLYRRVKKTCIPGFLGPCGQFSGLGGALATEIRPKDG